MERDACWAAALNQGTAHLNSLSPSPADSEFGMGSFSLSPIDFEPLPNLLFNSSTSASYKDFPVHKTEKNPHDVADVLLSLKHAVVHPGHQVPLPPLSPLANYPQYTQPTSVPHPSTPGVSYTMHPQPQLMPSMAYGQFGPSCLETTSSHHQTSQGSGNVFPSMSVNVSMNMTMGMAGMNYNVDANPPPHHQVLWNHPSNISAGSSQPLNSNSYSNPTPLPPIHMSYSAAANVNHSNSGSYSFTAEFRPGDFNREIQQPYKNSAVSTFQGNKTGHNLGLSSFSTIRKRASISNGITNHSSSVNCADVKNNVCRICGKAYARPSTLKTHLRTHSGEKPYRCSTCNKSFSQAANLTAHIRTHSGEKPFRCPICDRRFSQSSSVTTHMRTHSGERPYRCRLCKKAFSDSSTLTKHVRIHSGEKPYQCRLCLLRFSQSGNLNRHMRIHSGAG